MPDRRPDAERDRERNRTGETHDEHEPGRRVVDLDMGGSASHRRASFSDPIAPGDPDGVLGGQQPLPDERE